MPFPPIMFKIALNGKVEPCLLTKSRIWGLLEASVICCLLKDFFGIYYFYRAWTTGCSFISKWQKKWRETVQVEVSLVQWWAKMTKTLAHGYSSEIPRRELSNEYPHDRVSMTFKNHCILALWTKVAATLEGLKYRKETICLGSFFDVHDLLAAWQELEYKI